MIAYQDYDLFDLKHLDLSMQCYMQAHPGYSWDSWLFLLQQF